MANRPRIYSHVNPQDRVQGSILTKVHEEDQDLVIVDRLIEPQTIVHFLEFCAHGLLPTGKETPLERMTEDELTTLGDSPSASADERPWIERVMARIGSFKDGDRLCLVGKNIQSVKNRLWTGITPLSEQRWEEKGLGRGDNFDLACQHLSAVLAAWEYLNQPRVARNLRDTFNLIWDHWEELDRSLNERRALNEQPPISVTKLWTEFMAAHVEAITERAHRWVTVHVTTLRAPLMQGLATHRPFDLDVVDGVQWKFTDRLHRLAEIQAVADYAIMIPMHGYKGYTAPPVPSQIPAALRSPNWQDRSKAYGPRMKEVTRATLYRSHMARRPLGGGSRHPADPESLHQTSLDQINSQHQVRREVRGDPVEPVPREPWIVRETAWFSKEHNRSRSHGLVVYRLTYQQTDAEWAAVVEKLEKHVADWGRGQTGSAAIKPHLKLHWRDGRELGIAEDDVEAAKRHYLEHYSQDEIPFDLVPLINTRVFLVVDSPSVASYTSFSYAAATDLALPGDFTGFLLAVDATYDPREGCERPDESPGYHGQMRILGSLVWGDLYAMMSSQSAILEDLWPLALDHPNLVYVGTTVPLQIKGWRVQNGVRNILMRDMVDYAQAKINGTPWPTARAALPTSAPQGQGMRGPTGAERFSPRFAPEGGGCQATFDDGLRTFLMREFRQHLRDNNHNHEAVLVDEVLRVPRGQRPNIERAVERVRHMDAGDPDPGAGPESNQEDEQGLRDGCRPQ